MFKNPGSKIINVAAIFFALQIMGLVGMVVYAIVAKVWLILPVALVYGFIAWWSTIQLLALAQATEASRQAAEQATDAVAKLRQIVYILEGEDTSNLPTWKRLEIERKKNQ